MTAGESWRGRHVWATVSDPKLFAHHKLMFCHVNSAKGPSINVTPSVRMDAAAELSETPLSGTQ